MKKLFASIVILVLCLPIFSKEFPGIFVNSNISEVMTILEDKGYKWTVIPEESGNTYMFYLNNDFIDYYGNKVHDISFITDLKNVVKKQTLLLEDDTPQTKLELLFYAYHVNNKTEIIDTVSKGDSMIYKQYDKNLNLYWELISIKDRYASITFYN